MPCLQLCMSRLCGMYCATFVGCILERRNKRSMLLLILSLWQLAVERT